MPNFVQLTDVISSGGPLRCVAIGDSIVNGASDHSANVAAGNCWWTILNVMSKGVLHFVRNAGVPGDVSPRITARMWDELAAYRPAVGFMMQGTNDAGATPTPIPQAVTIANDKAFIENCFAQNILPIILACPPRGLPGAETPTVAAAVRALNDAKSALCASTGAIYIDTWTVLANTSTNSYADLTLSSDGVHPTNKGARLIAAAILTALENAVPSFKCTLATATVPTQAFNGSVFSDFGNAIKYGLFTTTGGGTTSGDAWTLFGNASGKTASLVANDVGPGNFQRVTWGVGSAGARSGAYYCSNDFDVSALRGKRARFSGRVRTINTDETFTKIGARVSMTSIGDTGSAGVGASPLDANSYTASIADGVFSMDVDISPSATTANVLLSFVPGTLTLTASPSGATSGTLSSAFSGPTGSYDIYFSDGSVKTVTLTNGSTAVSWSGAVTATATLAYAVAGTSGSIVIDFAQIALVDTREDPKLQGLQNPRAPRRITKVTAATYTIKLDDDVILVDATANAVTLTLPSVGINNYSNSGLSGYGIGVRGGGLPFTIKKVDASANVVTIAAASGENIEGAASISLSTQWSKAIVLPTNGGQSVLI